MSESERTGQGNDLEASQTNFVILFTLIISINIMKYMCFAANIV